MAYPNFKNKHLEEALFSAHDYVNYRKYRMKDFPSNYVILYHGGLWDHLKRKYGKHSKKISLYNSHSILKYGNVGLIRMNGIGSPHAVTLLEELIALGGRKFINVGMAGGLQKQGVFVCSMAIRDEGTSYHYIPHGKFSYPDAKLTADLVKTLRIRGIKFEVASTWTMDAPYRETKAEIEKYHKGGVATVEMEASALFAVAEVKKVKMASAFVVSDVLDKKWDPQFDKMDVRKALNEVAEAAIDCLMRRK